MVGNAEPGKEYNYRPLSKLCECQLDVNDQVSTKGPEEGGLEQERAELQPLQTDGQERQTGEMDRRKEQGTRAAAWPAFMAWRPEAPGAGRF